jgi:twitching motility protein PilT
MTINDLLSAMGKHNATDLHIRGGEPPVFRVAGDLVRLKSPPLDNTQVTELLSPLLDERLQAEMKVRGYADFSHSIDGVGRFRCNIYKALGRLTAAIRRVKPKVPNYEELSLPPQIKKCALFEQGLVLVGGITGSGKSTSLAAILDDINHTRRCHILTIEDPVEYVFADDKAVINRYDRELPDDHPLLNDDEWQAVVNLISAAPKLLDVVRRAQEWIEPEIWQREDMDLHDQAVYDALNWDLLSALDLATKGK